MKCTICERGCYITEGMTGACRMYRNKGNVIEELYPDHYLLVCPISVETMPMLHFHPAAKFLQISTIGCNLDCPGCISTVIVKDVKPSSEMVRRISPETIVEEAEKCDCKGIAFLMNDPLASFETFLRVAAKAKERGLMVGCSSNSYFTETSLQRVVPHLDFIHVGFKGGSDASYRLCKAGSVRPVLRNLRILFENGVHVEASCVHKSGQDDEIQGLAGEVASISQDIPLHIMRFVSLEKAEMSLEPSIRESERLCDKLRQTVRHVYLFNSPGTRYLDTRCSFCGDAFFRREFYGPMGAKIKSRRFASDSGFLCPSCGKSAPISGEMSSEAFSEPMFEGGYPFTRALEIIQSILIAIGVTTENEFVKVWDHVLGSLDLQRLHHAIQAPESFLGIVHDFGKLVGKKSEAETLIEYIVGKLNIIKEGVARTNRRPRVYYVMGKPWFCLNSGRMENNLIECAGGVSLNKLVPGHGRPGFEISAEQINRLNPQFIFVSALFGSPLKDLYDECTREGIDVDAVRWGNIHDHPVPVSDFGSPRWILGLMHIANVLHPQIFCFDVIQEAREFYRRFYRLEYSAATVNRSFGKPSSNWAFKRHASGA